MKSIQPSKVPFFSFSSSLPEQQRELEGNPLLQRMSESRTRMKDDKFRPKYHYVNPEGNLNDPNGLCFWQGNWHLFYQAYPPEDTRQHWGHAISHDLIHWRDLPYAIYPVPENCCFSGATLVEENRVIAMYHGTEVGNIVAISDDPLLLNWKKLSNAAVIPLNTSDRSRAYNLDKFSVYDPCIWKCRDHYYSLSGGVEATGPSGQYLAADFLFKSKNLINWEFVHSFIEGDIFTRIGDDGACPYFWPIGDQHILLFFSHMSGGQYILGSYDIDKQKFSAEKHGLFNFGAAHPSGLHAPSAAPCDDGSVIVIFNMNKGKDCDGWDQIMTLPRKLSLKSSGSLEITPAGDIQSLRDKHIQISHQLIQHNEELKIPEIYSNSCELDFKIHIKDCSLFAIDLLSSSDKSEYTRICFYPYRGFNDRFRTSHLLTESNANVTKSRGNQSIVSIDSSNSSILSDVMIRPPECGPFDLDPSGILDVKIFIDCSVVEVFIGNQQCLAVRVYPGLEDSKGLSVKSYGGKAEILNLDVWEMKSIYTSID